MHMSVRVRVPPLAPFVPLATSREIVENFLLNPQHKYIMWQRNGIRTLMVGITFALAQVRCRSARAQPPYSHCTNTCGGHSLFPFDAYPHSPLSLLRVCACICSHAYVYDCVCVCVCEFHRSSNSQ
jgi:hypothetical protein